MPRASIPSGNLSPRSGTPAPGAHAAPPPLPARGAPQQPDEVTHPIDLRDVKEVAVARTAAAGDRPPGHVAVEARVRAPSRRPFHPESEAPPSPKLEVVDERAAGPRPAAAQVPPLRSIDRAPQQPRFAAPPPLLKPDERRLAEAKAKADAEAKAKADAEAKAKADALKADADARARAETEARAKAEADARAAEAKAKAEADARAEAEARAAEAKAKAEAEAKVKAEADAKLVAVAEARTRAATAAAPIASSPSPSAPVSPSVAPPARGTIPPVSARGTIPPTASTPGFLMPRPLSSSGAVVSPGGASASGTPSSESDAVRERLAQLEVTANAARSIASRLSDQIGEVAKRSGEQSPRLTQLEQDLAALRARHAHEIAEVRERAERPLSFEGMERRVEAAMASNDTIKTAMHGLRVEVDAHSRAFDARKLRIDAIEHELSALRGDQHLAELRRAVERLDLRIAAIEESVSGVRAELAARPSVLPPALVDGPPSEGRRTGSRRALDAEGPPPTEGLDALGRIKGVGPKTAKILVDAGYASLASIAAWDQTAVARVAELLGKKPAQIEKAGWSALARDLLAPSE